MVVVLARYVTVSVKYLASSASGHPGCCGEPSREVMRVKGTIEELKPALNRVFVEEVVRSIRLDRERG